MTGVRNDPYELASVRRCFQPPTFSFTGWSLKALSRLGDRVGASYLMSVPEHSLYDSQACRAFARAAVLAFESSSSPVCPSDRIPYFTVFLLDRMLEKNQEPVVRRDVAEALVKLRDLAEKLRAEKLDE